MHNTYIQRASTSSALITLGSSLGFQTSTAKDFPAAGAGVASVTFPSIWIYCGIQTCIPLAAWSRRGMGRSRSPAGAAALQHFLHQIFPVGGCRSSLRCSAPFADLRLTCGHATFAVRMRMPALLEPVRPALGDRKTLDIRVRETVLTDSSLPAEKVRQGPCSLQSYRYNVNPARWSPRLIPN